MEHEQETHGPDVAQPESGVQCAPGDLLECCLFFTANALARSLTRLGEEAFAGVGMAPSEAFALMLVLEQPGLPQKDLAQALQLAPSTVSRFVDTLVRKGLVRKHEQGRSALLTPTPAGRDLEPQIRAAWRDLYQRYSRVLGEDQGRELTRLTLSAHRLLDGQS